jgi:hypothetical protein
MRSRYRFGRLGFAALAVSTACQPQEHRLREFVDVGAIDSVEAHNNSGAHWLTAAELADFKTRFGAMHYRPGGGNSLKMGATRFVLHARGQAYHLSGSTHGQHLEAPNGLASQNRSALTEREQNPHQPLLFQFDRPTNLDNYRRGPKVVERR